jgi:hypothetical protein
MNEVWKDVNGYEGLYQVSNLGRVKSFIQNREHILSPAKTKKGYLYVRLFKNDKRINFRVHRLVALAFIPNTKKLESINHKNEAKTDNRADNLEWCTPEYNNNYGSRNQKAGLSNSKPVVMLNEKHAPMRRFASAREASRQGYGSFQCIGNCCLGKQETHRGRFWQFQDDSHSDKFGSTKFRLKDNR